MLLKLWFLLTLLLAALLLGTTFAHVLEILAKLKYDASLWTHLQQTLYWAFAWIGGPIELAAILASGVLAYLLRGSATSFWLAAAATGCLVLAFFVIWIFITNAANVEIASWTPQTVPSDWEAWRRQWDLSHAARFVLHLAAFVALTGSLIATHPWSASS
jgi:Anthrone oxygenase